MQNWRSEIFPQSRGFNHLQRKLDRMMDEFYTAFPENSAGAQEIAPPCDIEETESHYLFTIETPGVASQDLSIELMGDTLVVRGTHEKNSVREDKTRSIRERTSGSVERAFILPTGTEADKIEADYRNGVLLIAVPKTKSEKKQRVAIGDGKTGVWNRYFGRSDDKRELRLKDKNVA